MEFCNRCQKAVILNKEITGCSIDPETNKEEVRFDYRCSICNSLIKAEIEKSINNDVQAIIDSIQKRDQE